MDANWRRLFRTPSAPSPAGGDERRDSAEYRQAHSEARELVAAYLRDVAVTRSAQSDLVSPAVIPSARIELARRSAA